MDVQMFSQVLWAMGKVQHKSLRNVFALLLHSSTYHNPSRFEALQISQIIWAMGSYDYYHNKAFPFYMSVLKRRLKVMNRQEISDAVWGVRKMRYYDPEFMEELERLINQNRILFKSREISILLLTFADLGVTGPNPVHTLLRQFQQNPKFNRQDIANIAYAISILKIPLSQAKALTDRLQAVQYLSKGAKNAMQPKHLNQIRRAQLMYAGQGQTLKLPEWMENMCRTYLTKQCERCANQQDMFVDVVYEWVKKEFPQAERRVRVCEGQLEVNVAIRMKRSKSSDQIGGCRNRNDFDKYGFNMGRNRCDQNEENNGQHSCENLDDNLDLRDLKRKKGRQNQRQFYESFNGEMDRRNLNDIDDNRNPISQNDQNKKAFNQIQTVRNNSHDPYNQNAQHENRSRYGYEHSNDNFNGNDVNAQNGFQNTRKVSKSTHLTQTVHLNHPQRRCNQNDQNRDHTQLKNRNHSQNFSDLKNRNDKNDRQSFSDNPYPFPCHQNDQIRDQDDYNGNPYRYIDNDINVNHFKQNFVDSDDNNQDIIQIGIQCNTSGNYTRNQPKKLVGSGVAHCVLLYELGWQVISVFNKQWQNEEYRAQLLQLIRVALSGQDIGVCL